MSDPVKEKAIKIYGESDEPTQKALVKLFGKETFSSHKKVDVMKLKTIQDICKVAKVKLSDILPYKKPSNADEENTNNFVIIKLICKVLNQGWTPDWSDSNQKKHYPYFDASSGFRFCDTNYYYHGTNTGVGSRLCFETEELAKYAGKTFTSYYEKFIIK